MSFSFISLLPRDKVMRCALENSLSASALSSQHSIGAIPISLMLATNIFLDLPTIKGSLYTLPLPRGWVDKGGWGVKV
ncbi:MAG TPA: hypothetical protein V6D48_07670 [Oculatellaceae cyanobacterium]